MADKFEPRHPDYSGSGFSVWKGTTKDGKVFLRLKREEWVKSVCLFKVEEKPRKEKEGI